MKVKEIIKAKGFTLTEVANRIGISRVTLTQNLERNPTVGTLRRIADAIGCQVGDFFADEVSPQQDTHSTEVFTTCPHCGKFLNITIS